jgi:outer membrane protein
MLRSINVSRRRTWLPVFILTYATVIFAASAIAGDSLSLGQAVARALDRNTGLKESALSADAAAMGVTLAQSRYLPQADFSASYTRLGPLPAFNFGGEDLPLYPANNYDFTLHVRGLITDFGRTSSAVSLASSEAGTETDRIATLRREVIFQTVRSFYSILLLHQSEIVQQDQIAALTRHRDLITTKIRNGTATDYELVTTDVRIAAARNLLIAVRDALGKEEIAFKRYLELPSDAPAGCRGELVPDTGDVVETVLLADAAAASPEVKLASDAVRSAELAVESADGINKPVLFATGAYGFRNGFFPNLDVLRGNYEAGVVFQIPLFDGKIAENQQAIARLKLEKSRLMLKEAGDHLSMQVRQAIADLRASHDRYRNSHASINQAETALALVTTRYKAGTSTNLDLLDAETALLQAQLTELQSRFDCILSRYALLRVCGTLNNVE